MIYPGRIVLSLLIFVLSSCWGGGQAEKRDRIIQVSVGELKRKDVQIYIPAIGKMDSPVSVDVRSQVDGIIEEVYVGQGHRVKKGELLYKIDQRPFQAELNRAKGVLIKDQAFLEFSKKKLERYSQLVKDDYVSKLNYDEYKRDVEFWEGQVLQDLADVTLAAIRLDYCTIYSPIEGRISRYNVDPGNYVRANDTNMLTTIRQMNPLYAVFTLSQRYIYEVKQLFAMSEKIVEVRIPEVKDRVFRGVVTFFDNTLDVATGTILLKGLFQNDDYWLWPGEYIQIRVLLNKLENALVAPNAAIALGQKGPYVYVLKEDQTVELRNIKTGFAEEDYTVVLEGLNGDERVITNGTMNLRPGVKVHVVEGAQQP